jgi:hypothetical protein
VNIFSLFKNKPKKSKLKFEDLDPEYIKQQQKHFRVMFVEQVDGFGVKESFFKILELKNFVWEDSLEPSMWHFFGEGFKDYKCNKFRTKEDALEFVRMIFLARAHQYKNVVQKEVKLEKDL